MSRASLVMIGNVTLYNSSIFGRIMTVSSASARSSPALFVAMHVYVPASSFLKLEAVSVPVAWSTFHPEKRKTGYYFGVSKINQCIYHSFLIHHFHSSQPRYRLV